MSHEDLPLCIASAFEPMNERRLSRSPARNDRTALLILDLISDYEYPGGKVLLPAALKIAKRTALLKQRARHNRAPVIYVNDTRGRWESDQTRFVRRCLEASPMAAAVIEAVMPAANDYFIFKPRHSAFYATPLDELLEQLKIRTVLLSGLTAHQCVLFTAIDAHVRRYGIVVARDCVAAMSPVETRHALFILEHSTDARLVESRYIHFARRADRGRD